MLLLVLSLAVPGLALAETEIPTGQVVQLTSGETYLFGTEALKVEFSFDLPDNEAQTVNLRVGEAENSYAGWYLVDKVYAAKLDGRNTFILAGDYGPSDDDWTEIFYYNPHTQTLVDLGGRGRAARGFAAPRGWHFQRRDPRRRALHLVSPGGFHRGHFLYLRRRGL